MTAHGTTTGYRDGCRCDRCRDAKRRDVAAYRERRRAREAAIATANLEDSALDVDVSWMAGAACATSTLDFMPGRGGDPRGRDAHRAICAACPVLEPCRDHGVRYEEHGIWGGLTERERREERRARGITMISLDVLTARLVAS